jgi:hypothetical protein
MKGSLQFSTWLYRKLLFLYPEDLRRDFGGEMVWTFVADLEERGFMRGWRCAISELLTVALPGQRSNPNVLVPLLSFLVVSSVQSAELWVLIQRVTHVAASELAEAIRLAVLLPSVLSAMVALVVTRFYARCGFTTLRLG